MKKIIAFLTAVCAAGCAFASCGHDEEPAEEVTEQTEIVTESETEEIQETEPETEEPAEEETEGEIISEEETEAETEEAEETDLNSEAARAALENFVDSINNRDMELLVKSCNADMMYLLFDEEPLSEEEIVERLNSGEDYLFGDDLFDYFNTEGFGIQLSEHCPEKAEKCMELFNSEEYYENYSETYVIDDMYRFMLNDAENIYVMHVNGEWKVDIVIMPQVELMESLAEKSLKIIAHSVYISANMVCIDNEGNVEDGIYRSGDGNNITALIEKDLDETYDGFEGEWILIVENGVPVQVYYSDGESDTFAGDPEDFSQEQFDGYMEKYGSDN